MAYDPRAVITEVDRRRENERLAREAEMARKMADQKAFVADRTSPYEQSPHEFDRAVMRSPETLRRLLPYGADASSIALPRPQQDAQSLESIFGGDAAGPPSPFDEFGFESRRLQSRSPSLQGLQSADDALISDLNWPGQQPQSQPPDPYANLTDEQAARAESVLLGPQPPNAKLYPGFQLPSGEVGAPSTPPSPPVAGQPPSDLQPFSPPGSWGAEMERRAREAGEQAAAMNPPQRLQPPGRGSTAPNPFEGLDLGGMPGQEDIDRFAGGAGAIAPAPGQPQSLPLMSGPPRPPQPRPETQFAMLPNGPREWSLGIQTPGGEQSRLPRARPDDAPPTPAPLSPDVPIATQQVQEEQALLEEAPGTRLDPFSGPAPPLDPALAAAAERARTPQQPAVPDLGASAFNRPAGAGLRGLGEELTGGIPASTLTAPLGSTQLSPLVQDYATGNYRPPAVQQQQVRRRQEPLIPETAKANPNLTPLPPEDIGSDVAPASPLPIAVPPLGGINQGQPLPAPPQSRLYPEQEQEFTSTYDPPAINLPPLVHSDVGGAGPTYSLLGIGGDDNEPVRHAPLGPEDDPDYKFQKFGQPRSGSGIGKWLGGTAGTLLGLATGGPIGGVMGGVTGWKGGKRIGGGIGDQETGWGRRFTNPNYKRDRAQEIADQKANELYRKWGIDVTTIAGQRLLPRDAQGHPLDPVTGKRIDRNEDDEDEESKTPEASKADSAKTGGVYGGGGSGLGSDRSYVGGVYGGLGGRDIGYGVGGAYRSR